MLKYALKLLRRSDGLVTAIFPDVPGAVAYGRDDEEALEQARPALEAALARYLKQGFELPVARTECGIAVATDRFEAALPA